MPLYSCFLLKGNPKLALPTALLCLLGLSAEAQSQNDSFKVVSLETVTIKAYEQTRKLKDIPAAVSYIGRTAFERFGPTSIVQAVNSVPGVRMEERSPGSYRFNIRGSALRSPFGVRNIKVYFNDLPYTDPGGHTYLNQLGYYNFNSLEIIKGPGSSLYGSGTGGVLLIQSLSENEQPGVFGEYAVGSFGLQNIYGSVTTGNQKFISKAGIQHQESDGYRQHSSLRRDVMSWSGLFRFDSSKLLRTTFLYGDLYYNTPGALTRKEYESNPTSSRPGNAAFPGAIQANASVSQKTFLAGASYSQQVTSWLHSKTSFYGAFTQLRNPTIQNFGRSSEPHVGGRSVFTIFKNLNASVFTLNGGAEWQQGFTTYSIHDNKLGQPDTLRTSNEVNNRQSMIFLQATVDMPAWVLTAGISSNQRHLNFRIFQPNALAERTKDFDNTLTPRLAILRKLGKWNVYSSVSKGFSPPTTEEVFPTGGVINLDLSPEEGINYDLGVRADIGRFYFDINSFFFTLDNTIVQRRTAGGGNFYINGGKTRQSGLESYLSYKLFRQSNFLNSGMLWLSHTWHYFRYKNFEQTVFDTNTFRFKTENYSGNALPGIPEHAISSGLDIEFKNGFLGNITYYFNDRIPVTDANTEYADAFHLLGAKLGYQIFIKNQWRLKLVAGADNLLDERYSLGNDINGFGGRYYNAASGRNYYTSLIVQWKK